MQTSEFHIIESNIYYKGNHLGNKDDLVFMNGGLVLWQRPQLTNAYFGYILFAGLVYRIQIAEDNVFVDGYIPQNSKGFTLFPNRDKELEEIFKDELEWLVS